MDEVVGRLERWLAANKPEVLGQLAPGATDEQLAACETAVGAKLPPGLRALLRWRNGNKPDGFSNVVAGWMLSSTEYIASTHTMMNGLADHGHFSSKDWWRSSWIPVLSNGGGDHVCIDRRGAFSGEPNQLIQFWHDNAMRKIVAPSFDDFLTAYVDALESGLWSRIEDSDYQDLELFDELLESRFAGYPFRAVDMDGRRGKRPPPPPPPVEADASRPVKIYSAMATFSVGDSIRHPAFGAGVVQRVEQTKFDVLFGGELKTLVHAKSDTKLEKPKKRDDGSPPGRPPF
ncbi:MAG TPA: SMI1/KNR4 family protein [Kofleriaceae bacterium]|jgi:cell wall assembly regulator SMI1